MKPILPHQRPAPEQSVSIMGILNVTPDSFSDGGRFVNHDRILPHVDKMIEAGADMIDVGGESTRPFAAPVTIDEELKRVIPAIEAVRERHTSIPISIDTTKAPVAREALAAGAHIINDISGLRLDPEMAALARETEAPVIIMHMQGTPQDMQLSPHYEDVMTEIKTFFQERLIWIKEQGINLNQVIIDPGIGFGKGLEHNLTILKHLDDLLSLGRPILIGHSRKSFINKILDLEVIDRDFASAVISALCAYNKVSILRVHDVEKTAQAVRLAEAILSAP